MITLPWTRQELHDLLPKLKEEMEQIQQEANCRPLPPMTMDEARNFIHRLHYEAERRLLTKEETFLLSQLLAAHEMAVRANTLGMKVFRY
jgi:hypothetical protein